MMKFSPWVPEFNEHFPQIDPHYAYLCRAEQVRHRLFSETRQAFFLWINHWILQLSVHLRHRTIRHVMGKIWCLCDMKALKFHENEKSVFVLLRTRKLEIRREHEKSSFDLPCDDDDSANFVDYTMQRFFSLLLSQISEKVMWKKHKSDIELTDFSSFVCPAFDIN